MQKVTNKSSAPVVVTDAKGKRHTIAPGLIFKLEGDFTDHLFAKRGWISVIEVETERVSTDAIETDITTLREQYELLIGKKSPSAAKAATLQKAINEALAAKQAAVDSSGSDSGESSVSTDATETE
ncbi:hypothetical protein PCO87_13840 [Pectobacteriaceae bacterium C52]|uniref:hypothetical protein n=1 Tax=Brenneria uluponensis TaxID=3057057 RepID=UPI0028E4830C|nr:hypothetical protein [Brenneria ulupoensis]WJV61005.1 hypothetical protein PCO87_13840 [Pectobacteriaceae bacterium C52]